MTCSCPGTTVCYHIVAAQIVLNCSDNSTKRPCNSTLMRKNLRKAADKRCGGKKPRVLDVDPSDRKKKAHVAKQSFVVELSVAGTPIVLSVPTTQTPSSVTYKLTSNTTAKESQTRTVVEIADDGVDKFLIGESERDLVTDTLF